jgi:hypothetical protein
MITLINTATGEEYRYTGTSREFCTEDSFCVNAKGSNSFKSRFRGVAAGFILGNHTVQVLLREPFKVKECLIK